MIAPRRRFTLEPTGPQRGLIQPRARASWLLSRGYRSPRFRPAGRGSLVVAWIVGVLMVLCAIGGVLGLLARIAQGP